MKVLDKWVEETAGSPPAALSASVKVKESKYEVWKKTAEVVSSSSSGAGFYIDRACQVGRLVSMMFTLPQHLRCYDHDKELYQIWGIVQHCHTLPDDAESGYHVGVAFVGKHAPESYRKDPTQSFRICGMNEDGLWKIKEAARDFKPRKSPRYYHRVNHYLAVVGGQNPLNSGEWAVTENISKDGAAVVSALGVYAGDRVKFISEKYDFSALAIVCDRQEVAGGRARLSLQFVENSFPIRQIALSANPKGKG